MKRHAKLTLTLSIIFTVAACGAFSKRKSDSANPEAPSGNQTPTDNKSPPTGTPSANQPSASSTPVREAILGHWKTGCFLHTSSVTGTKSSFGRIEDVTFSNGELAETEQVFEDSTCKTLKSEMSSKSTYVLGDNNRNLDTAATSVSITFFTPEGLKEGNELFTATHTEACPMKPWVAGQTQSFTKNLDACNLNFSLYTIVELKDGQLFMGDFLDYSTSDDGSTSATRITKISSDAIFVKQN